MSGHRLVSFLGICAVFGWISCQSGEEAFIDDRLLDPCGEAYHICNLPAGCVLDRNHYVEGAFPGTRRLVVRTEERDVRLVVRLYISTMEAPGTEIIVRAYEPDCLVDIYNAMVHGVDVDIFDEAGDDRILEYQLDVADKGEHLIEIFSDASAEYLLIVTQR